MRQPDPRSAAPAIPIEGSLTPVPDPSGLPISGASRGAHVRCAVPSGRLGA